MTTAQFERDLKGLLADRRLLLILFFGLRLTLLIVYLPLFSAGMERGMSAGGDTFTYFQLAGFSADGLLPFRDWWSEFPPIPHFLNVGIFSLLGTNANYTSFAMIFSLIMIGFDTGNLLLVRAMGTRLHGSLTGAALAWIYALLAVPMVFIWWNFEPMAAFFLLLGTYGLLRKHDVRAGVWAGIGALVKFTPALILGAAWRFRTPGKALRLTVITLAIFGLVYGFLFAQNAAMTWPSLTAQFNKASYQSVWALIDGNYRTGNFGPITDRLNPDRADDVQGNMPVVRGLVRLAAAAGIGLFVFLQARRQDDKGLVAFVTITLLIFFLQAQGWSPQWMAQIVPLVLLCFPSRQGVMVIVLLSLVTFLEYPFLFVRTGDTGGEITGALVLPFAVLVLTRTLILVGVCAALYRKLRQEPIPETAR
ncbi:MAG: glycosyltransferase family 87 protein [bacterium]|nr:glycosyltransferase family 87 protein [bacterium]